MKLYVYLVEGRTIPTYRLYAVANSKREAKMAGFAAIDAQLPSTFETNMVKTMFNNTKPLECDLPWAIILPED